MRILLAIEDSNLRLSIELLLSQEPSVTVVGFASESEGLLALLESARPALVILDWDLPGRPINELLSRIRTHFQTVRFIIIAKEPALKEAALLAGADAFVVKGDPPEVLLAAFRQARSHHKIASTVATTKED